jgi:hypothetical protein
MTRLSFLCLAITAVAAAAACGNKSPEAASKPKVAGDKPAQQPEQAPGRTHECHDRKRVAHQCAVTSAVGPAQVKVGEAVVVRVTVKPKTGYHVNKEFPILLSVTPPAGVDVVKLEQGPEDAARLDPDELAFDVKFTPKMAGDKSFTAAFNFAVCTEEECDPLVDNLAWQVAVK